MEGLCKELPVSLYIHIPYCTRKCSYCAFYSLPKSKWVKSIHDYHSLIISEIRKLKEEIPFFDTLSIGGGNPGLMADEEITSIIEEASENKRPYEITIEMNPEEVTEKRISLLKDYVDRISIGIQSLNAKGLETLGRNSSLEENMRALEIISESGISFNGDLITAIPDLSVDDILRDIEKLAGFNPGHISFYCLSYEENTPLFLKAKDRDEDYEADCLEYGWKMLKELGYEHYEISNFAKGERYSRHNVNYWRMGQYIGLGPAAESSIGSSQFLSNHFDEDIGSYFADHTFHFEKLSRRESALEYVMTSLRTKWGIDKNELLRRFSISFDDTFSLKELSTDDYVNTGSSFALTEQGFMILDYILLSLAGQI